MFLVSYVSKLNTDATPKSLADIKSYQNQLGLWYFLGMGDFDVKMS